MRTVVKFAILFLRSRKGTIPRTLVGRTRYHMGAVSLLWLSRRARSMLASPPPERIIRSLEPGHGVRVVSVPTRRGSRRDLRRRRREIRRAERARSRNA